MLSAVQLLFNRRLTLKKKKLSRPCCDNSQVYDIFLLSIKNILPKYNKLKGYLMEKEKKNPLMFFKILPKPQQYSWKRKVQNRASTMPKRSYCNHKYCFD